MFIDQLKSSALEDCAAFYESDVTVLLTRYQNSAVNETELLVCEFHPQCSSSVSEFHLEGGVSI